MPGWGPKVKSSSSGPTQAIPVYVVGEATIPHASGEGDDPTLSYYSEAIAVASGVETTILQFVIPSAPPYTSLLKCEFGGGNIGTYKLYFDNVTQNQFVTYYSGNITGEWDYETGQGNGLEIPEGTVVKITILHTKPDSADFYATMYYRQIN